MLKKSLLPLTLLLAMASAQAQSPAAPAAPATAAPATSSTAKKDLAARIIKLQQPAVEGLARSLVEQPAADLMERAALALPQRVAPDKRESTARDIQADVKKFVDDTVPLVRERAIKVAPLSAGALLEEKFTEDELRQVVSVLESPAFVKFQQIGPEMKNVLVEKLLADTRGTVEPRLRALEQSISKRLGIEEPAAATAPAKSAKPAKPASK
ncbi:MAG: hypothetical protein U1D29_10265 [Burkholderiales bacterium]|nr:hypothetical protein [Burkholderiales bacterium]